MCLGFRPPAADHFAHVGFHGRFMPMAIAANCSQIGFIIRTAK
jgi:hypothetical protein